MKNTSIEWAHHTFNAWIGCTKVSPACDNCYAEKSMPAKFQGVAWGSGQPRKRTSEANWKQPLRWNADCAKRGVRERVFCASLADVFDNEVSVMWRAELLELIDKTPHLDWLLLTKRIGNAKKMLDDAEICLSGHGKESYEPRPNVWLGATICNQEEADRDIPKLLVTPAAKQFLSIEPMLGPVDLREIRRKFGPHTEDVFSCIYDPDDDCSEQFPYIDWVIVGGESGKNARPMHPEWARSLRDQCTAAGVPFLFKQWGEWVPRSSCYHTFENGQSCSDIDPGATKWPCIRLNENGGDGRRLENEDGGDSAYMQRVGKKTAGRLLDGREWNGVPS
jgi:protein gp37